MSECREKGIAPTLDLSRRQTADDRLLDEIHNQNIKGVEELLTIEEASVDGSVDIEIQPIALAANLGQADTIQLLHERGANLEASAPRDIVDDAGNQSFRKGWRPLHFAVRGGKVASLHALLKAGADPNGTDPGGMTPLMTASKDLVEGDGRRRYPLVQALCEEGGQTLLSSMTRKEVLCNMLQ